LAPDFIIVVLVERFTLALRDWSRIKKANAAQMIAKITAAGNEGRGPRTLQMNGRHLGRCGIEQNDIVVSIVTNSDADWSLGNGRAQFVTGEL
jgi:hypothetical protein